MPRPKKTAYPFTPTLHLDNQRAWRQGENAVFLPIIYDLPGIKPANPDAIIIQVTPLALQGISLSGLTMDQREKTALSACGTFQETPPDPAPFTAPAEILSWEEKRKNLASLKKKAETGDFRAPKQVQQGRVEVDLSFSNAGSNTGSNADSLKSRRLSKSVLLLLLGVFTLVLLAWMAFR